VKTAVMVGVGPPVDKAHTILNNYRQVGISVDTADDLPFVSSPMEAKSRKELIEIASYRGGPQSDLPY
jgi:hypothetical protein